MSGGFGQFGEVHGFPFTSLEPQECGSSFGNQISRVVLRGDIGPRPAIVNFEMLHHKDHLGFLAGKFLGAQGVHDHLSFRVSTLRLA